MKYSHRHFIATSRNRAKKSIKAVLGLIGFHLNVSKMFRTLHPDEIEQLQKTKNDLSIILDTWEPLAPGMEVKDG